MCGGVALSVSRKSGSLVSWYGRFWEGVGVKWGSFQYVYTQSGNDKTRMQEELITSSKRVVWQFYRVPSICLPSISTSGDSVVGGVISFFKICFNNDLLREKITETTMGGQRWLAILSNLIRKSTIHIFVNESIVLLLRYKFIYFLVPIFTSILQTWQSAGQGQIAWRVRFSGSLYLGVDVGSCLWRHLIKGRTSIQSGSHEIK